ncbi:rCG22572 [Rattus norvegicus]|uniref:RCG22572 n=1 Tax=Rattus norvegicus TaxID=10116 RepID=A6INV0_RAT|nr:rCG22572 [Rattus norvegicus]
MAGAGSNGETLASRMEERLRKRRDGAWNVLDSYDILLHLFSRFSMLKVKRRPKFDISYSHYITSLIFFIDISFILTLHCYNL